MNRDKQWGKIHRDFKTIIEGKRYVMDWVPGKGTCLVPWEGTK